jgi:hypothetical protein
VPLTVGLVLFPKLTQLDLTGSADLVRQVTQDRAEVQAARRAIAARAAQRLAI